MVGWVQESSTRGSAAPATRPTSGPRAGPGQVRGVRVENVRLQPVSAEKWEPTDWSLAVTAGGQTKDLDCFPVPYSKPTDGLEATLVTYNQADHAAMAGKVALGNVGLITVPATSFVTGGSAPADTSRRIWDSEGSLTDAQHTTPLAPGSTSRPWPRPGPSPSSAPSRTTRATATSTSTATTPSTCPSPPSTCGAATGPGSTRSWPPARSRSSSWRRPRSRRSRPTTSSASCPAPTTRS